MKFAIAQYTNLPGFYTSRIDELSVELGKYFATKNYGIDLDAIYIGLITVDKEFEEFFKPKRPKYLARKQQIDSVQTGRLSEGHLNLDVSISINEFDKLDHIDLFLLVTSRIHVKLDSVTRLSKLPNFDFDAFKVDFEAFIDLNKQNR